MAPEATRINIGFWGLGCRHAQVVNPDFSLYHPYPLKLQSEVPPHNSCADKGLVEVAGALCFADVEAFLGAESDLKFRAMGPEGFCGFRV